MQYSLIIFLGAGLGGLLRYWISRWITASFGGHFPYGTLVVNLSGCFLMGLLFVLLLERFGTIGAQMRALVLIGFLGGYTTFSSFSIETINLFESGKFLSASLNIFLSTFICIFVCWLGVLTARQIS